MITDKDILSNLSPLKSALDGCRLFRSILLEVWYNLGAI